MATDFIESNAETLSDGEISDDGELFSDGEIDDPKSKIPTTIKSNQYGNYSLFGSEKNSAEVVEQQAYSPPSKERKRSNDEAQPYVSAKHQKPDNYDIYGIKTGYRPRNSKSNSNQNSTSTRDISNTNPYQRTRLDDSFNEFSGDEDSNTNDRSVIVKDVTNIGGTSNYFRKNPNEIEIKQESVDPSDIQIKEEELIGFEQEIKKKEVKQEAKPVIDYSDPLYPTWENGTPKQLCRYFLEGKCKAGDSCQFFHDLTKLEKRFELCKFYLHGVCSKGKDCTYMHETYPCKYYHILGKCYLGSKCKLSHTKLDTSDPAIKEVMTRLRATFHMPSDKFEIEEMKRIGVEPLEKPPPGIGLLKLPPASHMLLSKPPSVNNKELRKQNAIISTPNLLEMEIRAPSEILKSKIVSRISQTNSHHVDMNWTPTHVPADSKDVKDPTIDGWISVWLADKRSLWLNSGKNRHPEIISTLPMEAIKNPAAMIDILANLDKNGLNIQDLKDRIIKLMGEAQVNMANSEPPAPVKTVTPPASTISAIPAYALPDPSSLPLPPNPMMDLPKPNLPPPVSLGYQQLHQAQQQQQHQAQPPSQIPVSYPPPIRGLPSEAILLMQPPVPTQQPDLRRSAQDPRDPRKVPAEKPYKPQYYDEDETILLIPLMRQIKTLKDPRKSKWNSPEHDNKIMDLTNWCGKIPDFYLESLTMRERVQNHVNKAKVLRYQKEQKERERLLKHEQDKIKAREEREFDQLQKEKYDRYNRKRGASSVADHADPFSTGLSPDSRKRQASSEPARPAHNGYDHKKAVQDMHQILSEASSKKRIRIADIDEKISNKIPENTGYSLADINLPDLPKMPSMEKTRDPRKRANPASVVDPRKQQSQISSRDPRSRASDPRNRNSTQNSNLDGELPSVSTNMMNGFSPSPSGGPGPAGNVYLNRKHKNLSSSTNHTSVSAASTSPNAPKIKKKMSLADYLTVKSEADEKSQESNVSSDEEETKKSSSRNMPSFNFRPFGS